MKITDLTKQAVCDFYSIDRILFCCISISILRIHVIHGNILGNQQKLHDSSSFLQSGILSMPRNTMVWLYLMGLVTGK